MEVEPKMREPPAGPAHAAVTIPPQAPPRGPENEWAAAACTSGSGYRPDVAFGGKLTVLAVLSGICLALSVAVADVPGFFVLALPVFVLALSFFCRCGWTAVLPKLIAIAVLQLLGFVWYLFYALITIEAVGEVILPPSMGASVASYQSCVNDVCQSRTETTPGEFFFEGFGAYYTSGALTGVAFARFVVSTSVIITLATAIRGVRAFRRGSDPPPYWLCGC